MCGAPLPSRRLISGSFVDAEHQLSRQSVNFRGSEHHFLQFSTLSVQVFTELHIFGEVPKFLRTLVSPNFDALRYGSCVEDRSRVAAIDPFRKGSGSKVKFIVDCVIANFACSLYAESGTLSA